MKSMKRYLSILLAALLLMSQATLPALAEGDLGAADLPTEEAEAPIPQEKESPMTTIPPISTSAP